MNKEEPPRKFKRHSDLDELVLAIVAIIFLLALASASGCTHFGRTPEPMWEPTIYRYSPVGNRCVFINKDAHRIDCDEPMIHDFVLIPLSDLHAVAEKFDRVKEWK